MLSRSGNVIVGYVGWVVKEVEATAEAEWVVIGLVESVALRFGPELVWILRHGRCWRRRCRVGEKGVGFHLTELRRREAGASFGKGEGTMAPFIDGDCYTMQNSSLAVSEFGCGHHVGGQVVKTSCRSGESVRLPIELFRNWADKP